MNWNSKNLISFLNLLLMHHEIRHQHGLLYWNLTLSKQIVHGASDHRRLIH
ncbi:unnamed protein product [Schistosoma mattheei]|uniref:Uncharacterized protein n=1 Tax=Schistosoma mattheei TaxID=31246 RepID=A0A3P8HB48_9TREM|nr:unnamed protein product [Schistosoma mattheei]